MNTLYVSDLDGTLLTKDERISDYSIQVLNRLLAEGMNFTYATARSLKTAMSATKGLDYYFPVIVYNGALIVRPLDQKILYKASFEESLKNYIINVLLMMGINPLVFGFQDGEERVSWLRNKENEPMRRYLGRRYGDERMRPVDNPEDLKKIDVFYFHCMGDLDSMRRAHSVFSRDSRLNCIINRETYRNDYWLEILSKEATKAVAVRKLKEIFNFEKVICFGDSVNDIPMFQIADECYAVMNADETLKQLSSGIIGYCEEDGVAKWLDEHSSFVKDIKRQNRNEIK